MAQKLHYYLSGPMTGMPNYNVESFFKQEDHMVSVYRINRENIHNPAKLRPTNPNPTWKDYMRLAVTLLMKADLIVMLDGWQNSRGAQLELKNALSLDMEVVDQDLVLIPVSEFSSILENIRPMGPEHNEVIPTSEFEGIQEEYNCPPVYVSNDKEFSETPYSNSVLPYVPLITDSLSRICDTVGPEYFWGENNFPVTSGGTDVAEVIQEPIGEEDTRAQSILQEAENLTNGARRKAYGHPKDNFQNIADGWNWWLKMKYNAESTIIPEDVAIMMTLLKVARETHCQKRDNIVDSAGYLNTYDMILQKNAEDEKELVKSFQETSSLFEENMITTGGLSG